MNLAYNVETIIAEKIILQTEVIGQPRQIAVQVNIHDFITFIFSLNLSKRMNFNRYSTETADSENIF